MSDKTWKAFERRVAKFFGCVRNALSGRNSKVTASDSLHKNLFIECKHRAKADGTIGLWDKTAALAKAEGKTPVVVQGVKNRTGFWITVHCDDLWFVNDAAWFAQHLPGVKDSSEEVA